MRNSNQQQWKIQLLVSPARIHPHYDHSLPDSIDNWLVNNGNWWWTNGKLAHNQQSIAIGWSLAMSSSWIFRDLCLQVLRAEVAEMEKLDEEREWVEIGCSPAKWIPAPDQQVQQLDQGLGCENCEAEGIVWARESLISGQILPSMLQDEEATPCHHHQLIVNFYFSCQRPMVSTSLMEIYVPCNHQGIIKEPSSSQPFIDHSLLMTGESAFNHQQYSLNLVNDNLIIQTHDWLNFIKSATLVNRPW